MEKIILKQTSVYRYNLYGEISQFEEYTTFITELALMQRDDSVALYINSPGGSVDIGASILNAIKYCPATVTAVVEAPSYSMASMIALGCHNLIMFKNTFLMFHNYSQITGGKGGELMSSMAHGDANYHQLIVDTCYPFLSKSEINKIRRDQDVYIYDNDSSLPQRMKRHFK